MNTITAILEPDADGTVHVPLPAGTPKGKIKVTASFSPVDAPPEKLRATPEMVRERMAALEHLRQLNIFKDIADPVAWQREIRQDRPLPGRD